MPLIQVSSPSIRRRVREGRRSGIWSRTRWPSYIASSDLYGAGEQPRQGGRGHVSAAGPRRARLRRAGGAHRRDRVRQEGDRHPRDRPARDRLLHRLLRDLLGQHRAPGEGDPRRHLRGAEEGAPSACSRAAPRAPARPAGSCSTTGTWWSTSSRPRRASTTAWKTSGAKPQRAPSAEFPSDDVRTCVRAVDERKGRDSRGQDRRRGDRAGHPGTPPDRRARPIRPGFEIGERSSASNASGVASTRRRRHQGQLQSSCCRTPAGYIGVYREMRSICSRSTAARSTVLPSSERARGRPAGDLLRLTPPQKRPARMH